MNFSAMYYESAYLVGIIIGAVLLAAGAFALRELRVGKQTSARIQKQGASPFLGHFPMEFAYWALSPIEKVAVGLKLSPNFFSWSCLALGLASGIAAAFGAISLAGGLSIVSALFDTLDGMVARSRGIASDSGEVLDAAIDRYTEFFFLAGVCIYYREEPWAMGLALLALLGSFMVSYTQAKAEAMKTDIPKGFMRRPERAAYLGAGAFLSPLITSWFELGVERPLHYPLLFSIVLVAVFANLTSVQRFRVLYSKLKRG